MEANKTENTRAPEAVKKSEESSKSEKPSETEKSTGSKKHEIKRVIMFTLFSISAGLIEIGSFSLLELIGKLPYWICYLTALILSVLWNFTLNRNFTFKSASNIPLAMLKVAAFYSVFTPASTLLGNYLAETLLWNSFLVTAMNMAANFVLEYLYDRFFVFGSSIDTRDTRKKTITSSNSKSSL